PTNFGGAWLAVASTSGGLSSQQSASVAVTVTLLPGLTPNTYTGTITITGTDGSGHSAIGSPQVIPVNLTVQAACTIAATPVALSFVGVAGQPNPATQPVRITASGTCTNPLKWKVAITNGTWLTAKPTSGTVSLTTSAKT